MIRTLRSPNPPHCPRQSTGSQGGFALIIALTLMAFMVLMLISLSTVTQVEVQQSAHVRAKQEARQAALLGMNIALAELQRFAGADRRITASATLGEADGNGSTAHHTAINGLVTPRTGARHWTGVWGNPDHADVIYTKTPTPVLLNWLVSGNEQSTFSADVNGRITTPTIANNVPCKPDNTAIPTNPNAIDLGDWALLVGLGSVSSNDDSVVAPLVKITPDGGQRYAWWVGDEGVKARYNLRDPYDTKGKASAPDVSAQADRYRMLVAQRNGIEAMEGMADYPVNPTNNNALIDSVMRREQLPISLGKQNAANAKNRFHDISLHSQGVLADSQSGGLRRDLGNLLANATLSGKIIPQVINTGSSTGVVSEINRLTNPRWEHLNSFYNQVVSTINDSRLVPVVGDENIHHITPVITQIRIMVRLRVEAAAAPDYNRQIYLGVAPVIVLGNPYNVPIRSDGVDFRFHSEGGHNGRNNESPVHFTLKNHSGSGTLTTENVNTRLIKRYDTQPAERSLLGNVVLRTGSFSIEPGESVVFTLADNRVATGSGLVVANMAEGVASIDPERAVDIPIGEATAGALNDSTMGITTNQWRLTVHAPSWGHLSLSMYERDHTENDPIAQRPLQRVEQIGLGGSSTITSHTFFAPDKNDTIISSSDPGEQFSDGHFEPYFYRLFHLVMPDTQFGSQRIYANYNMRAQVLRRPLLDNKGSNITNPQYFFTAPAHHGPNAATYFGQDLPPRWGNAINSSGTERVVLFDMQGSGDPAAPLLSIATLRNANLGFILNGTNASTNLPILAPLGGSYTHNMTVGDIGGYAVGSSWANPYLNRYYPAQGRNHNSVWETYFDTSYLLNTALFDRYFFSSVPQQAGVTLPAHLPNSRMLPLTADITMLQDADNVAANLMIEGAFNVNSTSVEAWKAVLSGMRFDERGVLFLRSLHQPKGSNGNSGDKADAYAGYRSLGEDEVEALAKAIVNQVRQRGPFMSLGHFINRKLASNASRTDPLALKGALQEALDQARTNDGNAINNADAFSNVTAPQGDDSQVYDEPQAAIGPQGAGAPGWLSQGDLLQALAPILSARSDTFVIRAYGQVRNPATNVLEAQAWCEALVQRLPEPVTPDNANPNEPADDMGRRFRVIDFRWLSKDDV